MYQCLMRVGKTLPPEVMEYLYQLGRQMHRQGKDTQGFKSQLCCGRLETEGKFVNFASITGMQFEGIIESESGETKVRFVIPSKELPQERDGKWYNVGFDGRLTPCEEEWN